MGEFYGYTDEQQLRKFNVRHAEDIILRATASTVNVCSRDKQCIGSIDSGTYLYADGSQDKGVYETHYRSEFDGNVYVWNG